VLESRKLVGNDGGLIYSFHHPRLGYYDGSQGWSPLIRLQSFFLSFKMVKFTTHMDKDTVDLLYIGSPDLPKTC